MRGLTIAAWSVFIVDTALVMLFAVFAIVAGTTLERVPGAYIQIGNGDGEGACEVHNPSYDFNDGALPYGASLFARLVERRLARMTA